MNIQPFTPVTTFKAGTVNGLDTSQKHQLQFFSDAGSQTSWFNSHMTYTYDNLTPLKFSGTTNVIKLPIVADLLQNCNYCMFLNANFNISKWYYAFITNVRAISPNACEVTLKIDTYQTYYFEANVQPCFVVREHVNNDTIGLHTIDEGLELGEYVPNAVADARFFSTYTMIIATTLSYDIEKGLYKTEYSESGDKETIGGVYGGLQSACNLYMCNINAGTEALANACANGLESGIVGAYLVPSVFVGSSSVATLTPVNKTGAPVHHALSISKNLDNLNGYTPKNNKLFTHPFNFLAMTDYNGNTAQYKYEDFSTGLCNFDSTCSILPNPEGFVWPLNYKGLGVNYNEGFSINSFPQVPFISDSYKAYLAQTQSSRTVANIATGAAVALGVAGAAFTGGTSLALAGTAVSLATKVGSQVAQIKDHEVQPQQMRGNICSNVLTALGIKDIHMIQLSIKYEYAETIDNYLSNFGYKVNVVKVPNLSGRASWNYCETVGCIVRGNMPNSARIEIQEMFNNGITLWHGDYIGDYSRANGII